jgi:hypothetical protein
MHGFRKGEESEERMARRVTSIRSLSPAPKSMHSFDLGGVLTPTRRTGGRNAWISEGEREGKGKRKGKSRGQGR